MPNPLVLSFRFGTLLTAPGAVRSGSTKIKRHCSLAPAFSHDWLYDPTLHACMMHHASSSCTRTSTMANATTDDDDDDDDDNEDDGSQLQLLAMVFMLLL